MTNRHIDRFVREAMLSVDMTTDPAELRVLMNQCIRVAQIALAKYSRLRRGLPLCLDNEPGHTGARCQAKLK